VGISWDFMGCKVDEISWNSWKTSKNDAKWDEMGVCNRLHHEFLKIVLFHIYGTRDTIGI
jgi:hypothetical protein